MSNDPAALVTVQGRVKVIDEQSRRLLESIVVTLDSCVELMAAFNNLPSTLSNEESKDAV